MGVHPPREQPNLRRLLSGKTRLPRLLLRTHKEPRQLLLLLLSDPASFNKKKPRQLPQQRWRNRTRRSWLSRRLLSRPKDNKRQTKPPAMHQNRERETRKRSK